MKQKTNSTVSYNETEASASSCIYAGVKDISQHAVKYK
jgi:hypothetical protein